ncbi:MAG: hypothetical protein LC745_01110 [Planctomycetia bacterium]|nr:hypothetical protein [Planctomycetia bacterium]
MAFSQTGISGVNVQTDGPELFITWDAPDPQGAVFQVYVDDRLSWYGTARRCHAPIPSGASGRNVWVNIATVNAGEAQSDHSSELASLSRGGPQVRLTWAGGTYLDPSGLDDVQGFRVYRGTSPGAPVDWSSPVDDVPAYPGRWVCDGAGLGGFGLGGFGRSASTYVWTSPGLAGGVWQVAVVPYDHAGNNRGTDQTVSVTVAASPLPPSPGANGRRLTYTYSGPGTRQLTLNWLPSPS